MSRKKKRTRKKKRIYSLELIGILFIFFAILTIGEFGFVGTFIANTTKFFVGQSFQFFAVLMAILGAFLIFKGKLPQLKESPLMGISLLYLTILLWLHLTMFKGFLEEDMNILSVSLVNLKSLFTSAQPTEMIGGGMIGAILYTISHFLFANVGSYILIGLLVFFSIMNIGNFSYRNLFKRISRITKDIFSWVLKQLNQLRKIVKRKFKENSIKIKKPTQEKTSMEEEKELVKEQKERTGERKHVPIEGMQQTILPFTDDEENIEKVEEEEDIGEDLVINFVGDEENEDYLLPPLSLLDDYEQPDQSNEYSIIEKNIKILEETFESFGGAGGALYSWGKVGYSVYKESSAKALVDKAKCEVITRNNFRHLIWRSFCVKHS